MYERELKTHDSSDREVKGRKRFRLRIHHDGRAETQVQWAQILVAELQLRRSREIVIEFCPVAEYCYTISVTSYAS